MAEQVLDPGRRMKFVAGWGFEIFQNGGGIDHIQLSQGNRQEVGRKVVASPLPMTSRIFSLGSGMLCICGALLAKAARGWACTSLRCR